MGEQASMSAAVEQKRTEPLPFRWSDKSEEAAVLVAEDHLTDVSIANRIGVGRTTLHEWKDHPEFRSRVAKHTAIFARRVMRRGIARLDRRVAALQDRWDRMQTVIQERGEDMQGIPGGSTGLLVRQTKGIGSKDDFREVAEYALDAALLRELREHEKQAAIELGQWSEKHNTTVVLARLGEQTVSLSDADLLALATGAIETMRRDDGVFEAVAEADGESADESANPE